MDFQLARNLSALARAQEEIAQALSHIDSLDDCLNCEIIMALRIQKQLSSWWPRPKQLFFRCRPFWRRSQMKEPVDYVMRKFLSSQRDENAPPVHLRPMSLTASNLRYSSQEVVVSQRESHLVMAILTHKQPYVAAYGVMMSPDDCVKSSGAPA